MNLGRDLPYVIVAVCICLLAFFLREVRLLLTHPEVHAAESEAKSTADPEEAADHAA